MLFGLQHFSMCGNIIRTSSNNKIVWFVLIETNYKVSRFIPKKDFDLIEKILVLQAKYLSVQIFQIPTFFLRYKKSN
jgi:hypothetical protein